MSRRGLGLFLLLTLAGWSQGAGEGGPESPALPLSAGPVPRVFYTQRGQFEVVVPEAADARVVIAAGRSVWSALAGPLGLPEDGFNTPVSVRLVPAAEWKEPAPFTVSAALPGLVTVRVCWPVSVEGNVVRRALVNGLILRQAVAWHGVSARITVPLWLEQGCAALSRGRERPAVMDMYQQESARLAVPPSLTALLKAERGAGESREREQAALWLVLQLQAESVETDHWRRWLVGLIGGADALDSLPRVYAGLWADAPALELWWMTSFYHQARTRTLPMMSAAESRLWLDERSRWLAVRRGQEEVLGLAELPQLSRHGWLREELVKRSQQTRVTLPVIHPFYSNALLSLGRLYESALKGNASAVKAALAQYERDSRDGRELEDTVGAILDTAPRS